jgi:hypothetical protein
MDIEITLSVSAAGMNIVPSLTIKKEKLGERHADETWLMLMKHLANSCDLDAFTKSTQLPALPSILPQARTSLFLLVPKLLISAPLQSQSVRQSMPI